MAATAPAAASPVETPLPAAALGTTARVATRPPQSQRRGSVWSAVATPPEPAPTQLAVLRKLVTALAATAARLMPVTAQAVTVAMLATAAMVAMPSAATRSAATVGTLKCGQRRAMA